MAKDRLRLTILCEDRQHESFFRKFLYKKGYSKTDVYVKKALKGKGSGEQFVREEYPKQVKNLRSKPYIASKGLLAVIDVDKETVEYRRRQLDSELDKKRAPNEKIFIATPKRHIETWIHYLAERAVNEDESYKPKKRKHERDCRLSAEKLAKIIHDLPPEAPDSLKNQQWKSIEC